MNVSGKINLFVREVSEKKIKIFETSFSRKTKEGGYADSVSTRVEFSKDFLPDEKKESFKAGYYYPIEVVEGFITTRGYENKDGKRVSEISLFVQNAKTVGEPKEIKKTEKAKPETVEDDSTIVGPDGKPLPF